MPKKKIKRDANGKFASKAVKEVKPAVQNVPTNTPSTGAPQCKPGATTQAYCPPPHKDRLWVRTSYEPSTSLALVAAKELIAFYATLGWVVEKYEQISTADRIGESFGFAIGFTK